VEVHFPANSSINQTYFLVMCLFVVYPTSGVFAVRSVSNVRRFFIRAFVAIHDISVLMIIIGGWGRREA
jgi:hypothetical protein